MLDQQKWILEIQAASRHNYYDSTDFDIAHTEWPAGEAVTFLGLLVLHADF